MINDAISLLSMILIGFSGGLIVGCGSVAFFSALVLVPRLLHWSSLFDKAKILEWAIILGVFTFTVVDLFDLKFNLPIFILSIVGLGTGIFVGMLAAALTEVLNVIPILGRRLRLSRRLIMFSILIIALGKIAGSLLTDFILI